MENYKPLIAIVGSARPDTVGNRVADAEAACVEVGRALARLQCRIAVYSVNPQFIEPNVIKGYIEGGASDEKSITCIYPRNANEDFASLIKDRRLLKYKPDASADWEVSFYKSLPTIDGMLIIGGGSSTLVAGHVALSMKLPIIAIAEFGGAAAKIWEYLSQSKGNLLINEAEVDDMTEWEGEESANKCIKLLCEQYNRLKNKQLSNEAELNKLREKADLWEQNQKGEHAAQKRVIMAAPFLIIFVLLLIAGLTVLGPSSLFTILFVLGLVVAGGTGATVRLLTPESPNTANWTGALIGMAVGLVFSLLYLVPQLIGETSFLNPDKPLPYSTARVQFISAMVFAFLAGLGFDFALEQLLQRARQSGAQVAQVSNPSNTQTPP